MSRTKKGSKSPGLEYWGKRPLSGCAPSAWAKHLTHKIERQRNKPRPSDFVDPYPTWEAMADNCTDESPCEWCLKAKARMAA